MKKVKAGIFRSQSSPRRLPWQPKGSGSTPAKGAIGLGTENGPRSDAGFAERTSWSILRVRRTVPVEEMESRLQALRQAHAAEIARLRADHADELSRAQRALGDELHRQAVKDRSELEAIRRANEAARLERQAFERELYGLTDLNGLILD